MDSKPTKDTERADITKPCNSTGPARIIAAVSRRYAHFWGRPYLSPEEDPEGDRAFGLEGERQAALHLKRRGYQLLLYNVRMGRGEIDLVCREGEELVFVEVKTREYHPGVRPSEAVNRRKQRALMHAAMLYLRELDFPQIIYRFDIVEVISHGGGAWEVTVLQNVFTK